MDQKPTANGSDKRNWRERLGIGTTKEMPKLSEDFKPVAKPVAPKAGARPAVKPAPMAPRAAAKPAAAASPIPPEKLADKLRAQREASEKMAEQRLQAAKLRAEMKPVAPQPVQAESANRSLNGNGKANGNGNDSVAGEVPATSKPKFSFAEEDAKPPVLPAAPVAVKPAVVPPVKPVVAPAPKPPAALVPPVLAQPVQPLGKNDRPLTPPRPPMQQMPPPPLVPPLPYQQQPTYGAGYQPSYAPQPPMPGYRPMDPAQRYQPPLPPMPPPMGPQNRGFAPPPRTNFGPQPRLSMPPQGQGYLPVDAAYAPDPRLQAPPRPIPTMPVGSDADLFDDTRTPPRRATASDYSQAYHESFDDEPTRSRSWIPLLAVLGLMVLVAGGLIYLYVSNVKITGARTDSPPVVAGPESPAKVTPESTPETPPADGTRSLGGTPSKKQIYDRIVGDKEIPGGDLLQSEEQPVAPADAQPVAPADPSPVTPPEETPKPEATGNSEELTPPPLPLPPPPGGNNQQGELLEEGKRDVAEVTPAASASEAADLSSGKAKLSLESDVSANDSAVAGGGDVASLSKATPEAPVPGEKPEVLAAQEKEVISDPPPKPVAKHELVAEKPKVKKVQKKPEKSLGDKPVVLVPPAKQVEVAAVEEDVASTTPTAPPEAEGGSLYDGNGVVDVNAAETPKAVEAPAVKPVVKKKKTLADLFAGEDTAEPPATAQVEEAPIVPPVKKKQVAALDPPSEPVASGGGFVVQLATFSSRSEANQAFSTLKAKHSALASLSGIVSESTVGGSKRFNLMAGVLQSRAQASALCSKLIAAGERDCQVRSR